jgi:hypothetical protein
VNNDPINWRDPSGRIGAVLIPVIEGLIVAAEVGIEAFTLWRAAGMADELWRQTADQEAVKDLADEASDGGCTAICKEDADTLLDWPEEFGYPGVRASENDVGGSHWLEPHIHIPGAGRGGHVPVEPGVTPR